MTSQNASECYTPGRRKPRPSRPSTVWVRTKTTEGLNVICSPSAELSRRLSRSSNGHSGTLPGSPRFSHKMTTLTPAQEAAIATPDPVFSSDGSAVKLYEGASTLELLPGCSAKLCDNDQPLDLWRVCPSDCSTGSCHPQKSEHKPQCVRRCRCSLCGRHEKWQLGSYKPRHPT